MASMRWSRRSTPLSSPYPHTCFQLQSNLINCYDRTATTVNANVGLATAGHSVIEVMGNGNASTLDQSFTLRQSPLTYVQAADSDRDGRRRCRCGSTVSPGRRCRRFISKRRRRRFSQR